MKNEPLWTEDECTRYTEGHEYLADAWQQLFGEPYDPKKKLRTIDYGDCLEHQFPGGISVWNIYGAWDEICKTEPESSNAK